MGFPTRAEYESLIYRLTDDSLQSNLATLIADCVQLGEQLGHR